MLPLPDRQQRHHPDGAVQNIAIVKRFIDRIDSVPSPGYPVPERVRPEVVRRETEGTHDVTVVDATSGDGDTRPTGLLPGSFATDRKESVRLGPTTVSLAALRARPELFAQVYERTRATVGYAECLCTDPPQKLVIRTRSDRFHLACWPGQRAAHAPYCRFHQAPDHLSGRSRYAAAIEEDVDGVRIHLGVPLTLNLTKARREALRTVGQQRGESRRGISLLGLLHHLWERSALNRWPGRRDPRRWRECVRELAEAIDEVRLDQTDLRQVLHIVRPYSQDTAAANDGAFDRFADQLGRHGPHVRHGLLLGEIRSISQTKYDTWRLALKQTHKMVYLDDALLTRLKRSYPTVFSAARPEDARQVVLLLLNRTPRGHLKLVDAAAMLCSADYIPADSSYEVAMAHALVAADRRFIKPLRYDQGNELFPDYVLIDVEPQVAVEIWGVKGRESYDIRRKAKLGLYDESTTLSLLEWDVAQQRPDVTRIPDAEMT